MVCYNTSTCPVCGSIRRIKYKKVYDEYIEVVRYRCSFCQTYYSADGEFWSQMTLPMTFIQQAETPDTKIPFSGDIS